MSNKPIEFEVDIVWSKLRVRFDQRQGSPVTTCEIRVDGESRLVSYGLIRCKDGDRYDAWVGRKMALRSALKGMLRSYRKIVWERFLELYPFPKEKSLRVLSASIRFRFNGAKLRAVQEAIRAGLPYTIPVESRPGVTVHYGVEA